MSSFDLSKVWPEWKVEGKPLGRGSYGVVYKAVRRDHDVESFAAIKVISIPQNESEIDSLRSEGMSIDATRTYLEGVVSDFVSEIQLMESFKGVQNIVSVEDYKVVEKTDEVGWDIYIRMELLTPFNSYISDKTMSEEDVIKLGVDICTALELCAERNVIHRDIKPQNIFINQFGHFKLGDFGIARKLENVTGGLSQKGSPNYMAPEVAHSTQYDATVDLYSLGIVLYQLMNKNRLPFLDTERQLLNPNERAAALNRRLEGEPLPVPCDASPAMAEVILCASNPDPSKRFASATAMKRALMSVANGTYKASEADLNKTMSVRHATQTQDPNRTTSVRKAQQAQKSAQKPVDTFGEKKKSKTPVIIAIVLAVAILVGGGAFVVPRLLGNNDRQESSVDVVSDDNGSSDSVADDKNGVYSAFDEEQIAAAIEEAEALAADEDYEGALTKIKTALVTYPKSEALQAKETEYTEALAAQVKAATLEEAASLAESGDYVSAIALIKNAQDTYGDDAEYSSAYSSYCASYKSEVISLADELAGNGDYAGAIQKIGEAIAVVGEDSELTAKKDSYESTYVSGVIEQADTLLAVGEFDSAEELVNAATEQLPNNADLTAESEKIAAARPVYLLSTISPYEKPYWYNDDGMFSMGGQTYTHGFTCMGYGDSPVGNETYFNLNGEYSLMSFTAGIVENNRRNGEVGFTFYADGELIYGFTMQSSELPTDHIIDVTGCKQLKIAVYDGYGVADGSGTYGLANIMITRNVSAATAGTGSTGLDDGQVYLLSAVTPYDTPYWYDDSGIISMGGQTYTHGFSCMGYGDSPVGNEIYFNLNGQYTNLSFTAGIISNNRTGNNVTFTIYADGEIIDSFEMASSELPVSRSVDVTGCRQLKISVYDGYWVADGSGAYGLADMILTKA